MNVLYVFLTAAVCLTPFIDVNASSSSSLSGFSSQGEVVGNYTLLGFGADSSVLLSNNVFYKPTRDKEIKYIRNWELNDDIRVLRTKEHGRYILANLRTGESVKTKIFDWNR